MFSRRIILLIVCAAASVGAPVTFAADVLVMPMAASSDDAKVLQQAQQAQQSGNHDRALELLSPLHESGPSMPDVPRLMAHSYLALQRYDKARAAAVEAIGEGRMTVDLLAILAQVDRRRGDEVALLNDVRLLMLLDVNDPAWRQLFGQLLATTGQPAAAESVLRQLVEASPAQPRLWAQLGNVLVELQRHDEAAAVYETAWRLGDRDPQTAALLAGLYQRLGDADAALRWLDRALLAQKPPAPKLRLQQAQLLYAAGESDAAAMSAAAVLEAPDRSLVAEAHRLLGRLAMQRHDIDAALVHWHKAVDAGSADRSMLLALGRLHFSRDEFDPARQYLARYITTGPVDRATLLTLARATIHSDTSPDRVHHALHIYVERFGLDDDARDLIHLSVAR